VVDALVERVSAVRISDGVEVLPETVVR